MEAEQQQLPEHFMYQSCAVNEAEGVGWAFLDEKSELVLYPFKFPSIDYDEVRVKINYSGICQSDVYYARRQWYTEQFYPMVIGHECVGEVIEVGSDVKKFKLGDIVGFCSQRSCCNQCEYCKSDQTNLCDKYEQLYDPYFGGYATHIQVKESMTFQIPKELPQKFAAPLMCAGVTVFSPLKNYAQKGQKCAVIGIGGLGHIAVQMANAMGLEVTALTSNIKEKENEIKNLGAKEVISSQDPDALKQHQSAFDIIMNTSCCGNNDLFKLYQRMLCNNGIFVQLSLPTKDTELSIDFMNLISGQKKIQGSMIGSHNDVIETLEFAEKHKVYPIIEEFPFEELPVAFSKQEKMQSHYRNVINVKEWREKHMQK